MPIRRPVLAIVCLLTPLVVATLPFLFDWSDLIAVIPLVSLAFAATIAAIKLIGGDAVPFKWLLVVMLLFALFAGRQWYTPALLTLCTGGILMAIDRYVGFFVPLIGSDGSSHRILPRRQVWGEAES